MTPTHMLSSYQFRRMSLPRETQVNFIDDRLSTKIAVHQGVTTLYVTVANGNSYIIDFFNTLPYLGDKKAKGRGYTRWDISHSMVIPLLAGISKELDKLN